MMHPLAKAVAALSSREANQVEKGQLAVAPEDSAQENVPEQAIKHFQIYMASEGDGNKNGFVLMQCKKSVHDTSSFLCAHASPVRHGNLDSSEEQCELFSWKAQKDDSGAAEMQMKLHFQVGVTMKRAGEATDGQFNHPLRKNFPVEDKEANMEHTKVNDKEAIDKCDHTTAQQVLLHASIVLCAPVPRTNQKQLHATHRVLAWHFAFYLA